MNALPQLTDATFDEFVGAADGAVVVDFWAEWCGPCKMLHGVLVDLAEELGDRVTFVGVDSDECLVLSRRFEVLSVPTLLVFVDGQLVKRLVGARPKAALREALDDVLPPVAAV
jgi:thioredoxin 1